MSTAFTTIANNQFQVQRNDILFTQIRQSIGKWEPIIVRPTASVNQLLGFDTAGNPATFSVSDVQQLVSGTTFGSVTQGSGSGKATAFTLSTLSGAITLNNAQLNAATIVSAVWTNTLIGINDVVVFNHISGGTVGSYTFNAQCAAGSATINIRNATAGNLTEAPVLTFLVLKGATG